MRRIIVISDLHIGGERAPMLGHASYLERFLTMLAQYQPPSGTDLELVINGDFIDFLAEQPLAAWTASEADAVDKLRAVIDRQPALFKAFAACAARLARFTILLGNHDIELAYPKVRAALFRRLGLDPHRVVFVASNEAYRVGDVLIEHGNRYDCWNAIDHDGLRQIVSAASRGEVPLEELRICPGSLLVHEVMNPLKERYHFIDLLKPEDDLVTFLLREIEPELTWDLDVLFPAASNYIRQVYRKARWKLAGDGLRPGERELVSRHGDTAIGNIARDPELAAVFLEELEAVQRARSEVGRARGWFKRFLTRTDEGLKAVFERNAAIDARRLRKIQLVLGRILRNDIAFVEHDRTGPYAEAAAEMVGAGVAKVVVMGHTHLARDVAFEGGRYLNTGTWADLLRIDPALLDDSAEARDRLTEWLRAIALDQLDAWRGCEPAFADILVTDDGAVDAEPRLRRYASDMSMD